MLSRLIFAIHCGCLLSLVASSLASVLIKKTNPTFFNDVFFPGFVMVSILTLVSWPLFGGCPLTKWENRFRKAENKAPYEGSCMVHTLSQLTGRRPNKTLIHVILIGIMAVPVAVRFLLE
ncbi:MAG: DUF2784 family protein [Candidatus Doudnabacteria bacterium]|jgi:hypothetical protein